MSYIISSKTTLHYLAQTYGGEEEVTRQERHHLDYNVLSVPLCQGDHSSLSPTHCPDCLV